MSRRSQVLAYLSKLAAPGDADPFTTLKREEAGLTGTPGANRGSDLSSLGSSASNLLASLERGGAPAKLSEGLRGALTEAPRDTTPQQTSAEAVTAPDTQVAANPRRGAATATPGGVADRIAERNSLLNDEITR